MQRWTRRLTLLLTPALVLSVALMGCSGDNKEKKDNKAKKTEKGTDGTSNKDNGEPPAGAKKAVKGKGTATITGTVTFVGDMADLDKEVKKLDDALMKQIDAASAEKEMCLKGTKADKSEFQWVVNKDNKGVANVFVWIQPATEDEFFDVSDLVKKGEFKKDVKLDQPHCAFHPHAFVLFQRYVDPKDPEKSVKDEPKTGQKFEVVNSAPRPHNTKWEGKGTKGGNEVIQPGKDRAIDDLLPNNYKGPIVFACSIHPWMKAYAWSFDHPFAAVTDENGKFEIKNVPAGAKVKIVAWHEEAGYLNEGGRDGESFQIPDMGGQKDFKAKK